MRWAIIKVGTASLSMLTSWDSLARGKKIGLRSNLEEGLEGNIGVVICGLIVLVKPTIIRLEEPVFLATVHTSNRFCVLTGSFTSVFIKFTKIAYYSFICSLPQDNKTIYRNYIRIYNYNLIVVRKLELCQKYTL